MRLVYDKTCRRLQAVHSKVHPPSYVFSCTNTHYRSDLDEMTSSKIEVRKFLQAFFYLSALFHDVLLQTAEVESQFLFYVKLI